MRNQEFHKGVDGLKSLGTPGLKVNTRKTKLMVSGSEDKLFKSKIDPCAVCGRESHGQFSVVYKMYLNSWKMSKNKKSYR